ncbi:MAG: glucosamine-6-phosphate deaminase [Candidatus Hydrogenedentota bacterium]
MEVIIQETANDAAFLTARLVADALRENPHLVMGLATGRTMEGVYHNLVRMHREEALDFSEARTFNLDEYIGLAAEDPNSYRYYMNEHLFHHVNIQPHHTHLPKGMARDIPTECRQYEALIRNVGGIDLQLLGIGRSGHIGFNEPLSALLSRTRGKSLAPATVAQNQGLFANDRPMPRRAITMGVGTILESKWCLLLVTGEEKAAVLAKAVEGPVTSMISATALQLHAHCTVIIDEAAASHLEMTEYYRWVFANEPEWAPYRAAKE